MKKEQEVIHVSIEYKNDKKAKDKFMQFIIDYLLLNNLPEEGEDYGPEAEQQPTD